MSNKIIFWETKTEVADAERTAFWKIVEALGFEITTDKNKLNGFQLLFLHGGDKKKLVETKLDGSGESYVKEVASVWKVIYGGNQTVQEDTNNEKQQIQYINLEDLSDRLNYIVPLLQNEKLSGELLEELLFDFDPKLEDLLKVFATADPFKATAILKAAKIPLRDHIIKLIQ